MATERAFIPWGEFKPDQKDYAHRDLTVCRNLVPVYGNYALVPSWATSGSTWDGLNPPTATLGLHAHPTGPDAWKVYQGDTTKLWEADPAAAFARTDKTRLAGAYGVLAGYGWHGVSFGESVIMTDYVDPPQILLTPGTARFVDLPTSTFQPRFRYVATLKNNVVGAFCNLPAPYDTLAAGANTQLVVWSQNENARAWGSPNVNPELVGADYQQLLNDFGYITGLIGGEYVLIAQQRGWVRMEGASGSSFSFRPIAVGTGCRFSRSIGYLDGDVWFWGPGGPSVFRGGEQLEVLGLDKVTRTLLDNTTGFSGDSISANVDPEYVSFVSDPANHLVGWVISRSQPVGDPPPQGDQLVVYNKLENRFTLADVVDGTAQFAGLVYPVLHPQISEGWLPFRDIVGIRRAWNFLGAEDAFCSPVYGVGNDQTLPELTTGFIQLDDKRATRILRVRPVFSMAVPTSTSIVRAITTAVTITSRNRVWDVAESAGPFNNADNVDGHGFVTTPGTKFADFHRVKVALQPDAKKLYEIAELKGIEVEYQPGPVYAR